MNAVLIRPDPRDHYPAPYSESDAMDETFSGLRADVRNLQIHVTNISGEVRATNSRLDSLRDMIERYRDEDRERVDARFDKMTEGIDARFAKVDERFEQARLETKAEFASLTGTIKWGLGIGLPVLIAFLSGVMARGFKWI
jgi:hypothetical protein